MTRINLLPWREELRRQRQRDFYVMVGASAILGLLGVVWLHIDINGQIDHQRARNNLLRNEIKQVEERINQIGELERQKEQLISRMRIIDQLQQGRPVAVHLLEQIALAIPDGLHLTRVTQHDLTLTIEGVAQSNARVSALMRALDQSVWLAEPYLEVISASGGSNRTRRFVLRVNQKVDEKATP
jgi:type IV pilus assembly protein PilN